MLFNMIAAAALATTPITINPAGTWAVRADGQPLMVLTIGKDAHGWRADWRRPAHFSGNETLTKLDDLKGGTVDLAATRVSATDRSLHMHFPPATPDGEGEDMTFQARNDGTARLSADAMPGAALVLDRADPGTQPITPDADASYRIDQHWPTNPEMTAIFDADQGDRAAGADIDWSKVGPRDAQRRARTKALLDTGKLNSGTDFWHAAFVFQHGEGDDYLLAHALAMIAVARGLPDATWIAAATLDRYLQAHDLKQIYGTQFLTKNGETTQEPYDRTLISDALRTATGVPTQAEQEKQRLDFQKEFGAAVTSRPARN